jgi:hypothetical protein
VKIASEVVQTVDAQLNDVWMPTYTQLLDMLREVSTTFLPYNVNTDAELELLSRIQRAVGAADNNLLVG